MPTPTLFGKTIPLLEMALDLRSRRHRVLASNLANVDTPNFKAFDLAVDEQLRRAAESSPAIGMRRTHAGHLPGASAGRAGAGLKFEDQPDYNLRGDGNTVDLDRTVGKMAENTLLYKTTVEIISKEFKLLRSAIQGGK